MKDVAALIHAKAGEVNKAVREAIIDGAANVKDQFQKALDVLENGVTCDKVLGSDVSGIYSFGTLFYLAKTSKLVIKFWKNWVPSLTSQEKNFERSSC